MGDQVSGGGDECRCGTEVDDSLYEEAGNNYLSCSTGDHAMSGDAGDDRHFIGRGDDRTSDQDRSGDQVDGGPALDDIAGRV